MSPAACLASVVERALSFSGMPVLALVDTEVVEAVDIARRGARGREALVTLQAAIRPDGPRYRGRLIWVGSADEFLAALAAASSLVFVATETIETRDFGPLLQGFGSLVKGAEGTRIAAELAELAGAKGGAATFAEIMATAEPQRELG